jgi:hypothetical protein
MASENGSQLGSSTQKPGKYGKTIGKWLENGHLTCFSVINARCHKWTAMKIMFDLLGLSTPAPLPDTSVSVTPNCGRTHTSIAHLSFTNVIFEPLAIYLLCDCAIWHASDAPQKPWAILLYRESKLLFSKSPKLSPFILVSQLLGNAHSHVRWTGQHGREQTMHVMWIYSIHYPHTDTPCICICWRHRARKKKFIAIQWA